MGALESIGYPKAEDDGTLRISRYVKVTATGDEVHLCCNGHSFVVCKIVDNRPILQVFDVDRPNRPKFEADFGLLCWPR